MPRRLSNTNWGTRSPIAFGCGKCRWRPLGCRGCIAAAAHYKPPSPPPVPPGLVSIPPRGVDEDFDREDEDKAGAKERLSRLAELSRRIAVTSEDVEDCKGSGVVARQLIRKGEVLIDPSVIFVSRPSEYAQAHLPQYHAYVPQRFDSTQLPACVTYSGSQCDLRLLPRSLELGAMGYFRLREPAFSHASLTYFVNEAQHLGSEGPEPNVRYKVVRPRGGGIMLGLEALTNVAPGTELLCRYNQKLHP